MTIEQPIRRPRWTNSELEDQIARAGGLFSLWTEAENLFQVVTQTFDRYIEFAETKLYKERPCGITYAILNNSNMNAFAYASPRDVLEPFDFVGINHGAVFTIIHTFLRILSHPDSFPHVGNRSLENASRVVINQLTTNILVSGIPPCTPNCPIRYNFANILSEIALSFLFFHEITHLRNGHLEYLSEHYRTTVLTEASPSNYDGKITPLIMQTLEWDADSGGIVFALNAAFNYTGRLEQIVKAGKQDNSDPR